MLAVSNVFTLELGSVPLVWVLPLTLYLLSYVFTFGQRQWISPTLLHAFWPAAVVCGLSSLYLVEIGNLWVFAAHLVALFALAMVGHSELHRLRPTPDQLTVFYLTIAFGGWMGSMAVSLVAPILFNSLAEYPIIVGVFALTILILRIGDLLDALRRHPLLSSLGFSLAIALPFLIKSNDLGTVTKVIYQYRNYYGIYKVFSQPLKQDKFPNLSEEERYYYGLRQLVHGSTIHGSQVLHPAAKTSPTSYYHRAGPLWDVLGDAKKVRNVAVIGLGVGTCATYFGEEESITFYELDPAIVNIAQNQNLFTYLADCPAEINMVAGDARLQLEQATDHSYDIIMVDAFSSDAIPTHLLTREALSLYEKKLAPQGTLVFHTSSRYYDLLGVIKSTSANSWECLFKWQTEENLQAFQSSSSYCALRRKNDDVSALLTAGWFSMEEYPNECEPWSDDYINTLRPLYLMLYTQSWHNDR
ncbi:MAG: fused MFS/spermidine synthase [Verrucomicrobiota bacterium]|nr:fused MFS/spermidine synthase [Verrucomicrobiota bacterium]